MLVPAFAYLYTKARYPARGIIAWATLGGKKLKRAAAVQHFASTFGISVQNARVLARKGDGIFWDVEGSGRHKTLQPYSSHELWLEVEHDSVVPEEEILNVPDEFLDSVSMTRAYLAQPTLTRGPIKPISLAVSSGMLSRAKGTVAAYRDRLRQEGRLETLPQYLRLREDDFGPHSQPLAPGEYVNKGWIYKRTADIVVITNSIGDFIFWPVHKVKDRVMAARKYFPTTKKLEGWVAAGQKIAKDAVLKVFEDWIPVENVYQGVYRDLLYTTTYSNTKKSIYDNSNIRQKSSLVKISQKTCIPALQGV